MSQTRLVAGDNLGALDKAFKESTQDLPFYVAAAFLRRKLLAQNILVTEEHLPELTTWLKSGAAFPLALDGIDNDQPMDLELTDEDLARIETACVNLIDEFPELIQQNVHELTAETLPKLKKDWPAEMRLQNKEMAGFHRRLYRRWKTGLDPLQMLLTMARESGANTWRILHEGKTPTKQGSAMAHLHARACQVTDEILCLMRHGFAEGALARWRTLHEIGVTASVIISGGEELAERFFEHQYVESKRGADEYQRVHQRMKHKPLSDEALLRINKEFVRVEAKYGKSFIGQYGWAAELLNLKKPTFADLELFVESDHYRSHYKWASQSVHATFKGTFRPDLLGAPPSTLLSGPSNAGLADPGHSAALSLLRITAEFATLTPLLDLQVATTMMAEITDEIGDALLKIHEQLAEEEEDERSAAYQSINSKDNYSDS